MTIDHEHWHDPGHLREQIDLVKLGQDLHKDLPGYPAALGCICKTLDCLSILHTLWPPRIRFALTQIIFIIYCPVLFPNETQSMVYPSLPQLRDLFCITLEYHNATNSLA